MSKWNQAGFRKQACDSIRGVTVCVHDFKQTIIAQIDQWLSANDYLKAILQKCYWTVKTMTNNMIRLIEANSQ